MTVTVQITGDSGGRSVAGAGSAQIKTGGLRNLYELVVVDIDAKKIISFDRQLRKNANELFATMTVNSVPFGKEYAFMLLTGYQKRLANAGNGDFVYDTTSPTLMGAGLKKVKVTGSDSITITLWPIVVDTKFKARDLSSPDVIMEPPTDVKKFTWVLPIETQVIWSITDSQGKDGLKVLKLANNNSLFAGRDVPLFVNGSGATIVRGSGVNSGNDNRQQIANNLLPLASAGTETPHTITLDISDYTNGFARINKEGSANFELAYVPFGADIWSDEPTKSNWIIRNGVNAAAQDANTTFASSVAYVVSGPGANGNGAVRFKPTAGEEDEGGDKPGTGDIPDVPGITDPSAFTISGEIVNALPGTDIKFTTTGYTDTAAVYYKILNAVDAPPAYNTFTTLLVKSGNNGLFTAGTYEPDTINQTFDSKAQKMYVLLYKNGIFRMAEIGSEADLDVGSEWATP
jgi:hypothetical protein